MRHMQSGNTWVHGSGLPWPSGAYTMFTPTAAGPDAINLFGVFRGRPCDVAVAYISDTSWSAIENPAALYSYWEDWPGTMSFATPLLPNDGVSTLAAGAAGSYNTFWNTFATNIQAIPSLRASIIRLGWEFNGNWYPWYCGGSTDCVNFAAYWRQVYNTVNPIAPSLQWDWCVNRGLSAGLPGTVVTPVLAFPGAAYVDYVGVDSYDRFNPYNVDSTMFTGTQGLNYWLAYAQSEGVLFSVPEWACWSLVPGNADAGGGDDPQYIDAMTNFFKANAASIGYESMFQGQMPVPPIGTLPNSAAAYTAALGPPAPVLYGVTLDDVTNLSGILTSIKALPYKPTVRIYFDITEDAAYYDDAITQIHPYAYIMGLLLDSSDEANITTAAFGTLVTSYLEAYGGIIDIWEVGNEVNGNWTEQTDIDTWTGSYTIVIEKLTEAYNQVSAAGYATALTLYANYPAPAEYELSPEVFSSDWVPQNIREGLDYVLLSYYEEDQDNVFPTSAEWAVHFEALRLLYPNAWQGFGEVGLDWPIGSHGETLADAQTVANYSYALNPQLPYYCGGYFWWYFAEDCVPDSNTFFTNIYDGFVNENNALG